MHVNIDSWGGGRSRSRRVCESVLNELSDIFLGEAVSVTIYGFSLNKQTLWDWKLSLNEPGWLFLDDKLLGWSWFEFWPSSHLANMFSFPKEKILEWFDFTKSSRHSRWVSLTRVKNLYLIIFKTVIIF